MSILGSQLTAFPATVPISPWKRFSMSPLENWFRLSHPASITLSNTSALIAFVISTSSFCRIRPIILLIDRETSALPAITSAASHS